MSVQMEWDGDILRYKNVFEHLCQILILFIIQLLNCSCLVDGEIIEIFLKCTRILLSFGLARNLENY